MELPFEHIFGVAGASESLRLEVEINHADVFFRTRTYAEVRGFSRAKKESEPEIAGAGALEYAPDILARGGEID